MNQKQPSRCVSVPSPQGGPRPTLALVSTSGLALVVDGLGTETRGVAAVVGPLRTGAVEGGGATVDVVVEVEVDVVEVDELVVPSPPVLES